MNTQRRYLDFNTSLKRQFGERVHKITVDTGFSCPNRDGRISKGGCIYCNPKGSGTGLHAKGHSIADQLESGKKGIGRRYGAKKFIVYFQSFTNTYAPIDKLKKVYEEALYVKDIVGLSIGTRPDCVNKEVLDLLEEYARDYLIWIEYGLQSAHDKTLVLINRGHDVACFKDAVIATKNRGIKICAHVILGLPNEKPEEMLETADFLADLGIHGVKLHLLYVIKGTALEKLYHKGKYRCLEQNEYIDIVCDFIERLPEDVVIQRLTGDPHPYELVAPSWSLKKDNTLALIWDTMEKRDSFQGKHIKKNPE